MQPLGSGKWESPQFNREPKLILEESILAEYDLKKEDVDKIHRFLLNPETTIKLKNLSDGESLYFSKDAKNQLPRSLVYTQSSGKGSDVFVILDTKSNHFLGSGSFKDVNKAVRFAYLESNQFTGPFGNFAFAFGDSFDVENEVIAFDSLKGCDNIIHARAIVNSNLGWKTGIILEFAEKGDLLHLSNPRHIRNHSNFMFGKEALLYSILSDVAVGLKGLHQRGQFHQDIAERNVLLDKEFNGRLADFGLTGKRVMGGLVASTAAPEVREYQEVSSQSDTFQFGVMMLNLHGFSDIAEAYQQIYKPGLDLFGENAMLDTQMQQAKKLFRRFKEDHPGPATDLIYDCLNVKPGKRPNDDELIDRLHQLQQGAIVSLALNETKNPSPRVYLTDGKATTQSLVLETMRALDMLQSTSPGALVVLYNMCNDIKSEEFKKPLSLLKTLGLVTNNNKVPDAIKDIFLASVDDPTGLEFDLHVRSPLSPNEEKRTNFSPLKILQVEKEKIESEKNKSTEERFQDKFAKIENGFRQLDQLLGEFQKKYSGIPKEGNNPNLLKDTNNNNYTRNENKALNNKYPAPNTDLIQAKAPLSFYSKEYFDQTLMEAAANSWRVGGSKGQYQLESVASLPFSGLTGPNLSSNELPDSSLIEVPNKELPKDLSGVEIKNSDALNQTLNESTIPNPKAIPTATPPIRKKESTELKFQEKIEIKKVEFGTGPNGGQGLTLTLRNNTKVWFGATNNSIETAFTVPLTAELASSLASGFIYTLPAALIIAGISYFADKKEQEKIRDDLKSSKKGSQKASETLEDSLRNIASLLGEANSGTIPLDDIVAGVNEAFEDRNNAQEKLKKWIKSAINAGIDPSSLKSGLARLFQIKNDLTQLSETLKIKQKVEKEFTPILPSKSDDWLFSELQKYSEAKFVSKEDLEKHAAILKEVSFRAVNGTLENKDLLGQLPNLKAPVNLDPKNANKPRHISDSHFSGVGEHSADRRADRVQSFAKQLDEDYQEFQRAAKIGDFDGMTRANAKIDAQLQETEKHGTCQLKKYKLSDVQKPDGTYCKNAEVYYEDFIQTIKNEVKETLAKAEAMRTGNSSSPCLSKEQSTSLDIANHTKKLKNALESYQNGDLTAFNTIKSSSAHLNTLGVTDETIQKLYEDTKQYNSLEEFQKAQENAKIADNNNRLKTALLTFNQENLSLEEKREAFDTIKSTSAYLVSHGVSDETIQKLYDATEKHNCLEEYQKEQDDAKIAENTTRLKKALETFNTEGVSEEDKKTAFETIKTTSAFLNSHGVTDEKIQAIFKATEKHNSLEEYQKEQDDAKIAENTTKLKKALETFNTEGVSEEEKKKAFDTVKSISAALHSLGVTDETIQGIFQTTDKYSSFEEYLKAVERKATIYPLINEFFLANNSLNDDDLDANSKIDQYKLAYEKARELIETHHLTEKDLLDAGMGEEDARRLLKALQGTITGYRDNEQFQRYQNEIGPLYADPLAKFIIHIAQDKSRFQGVAGHVAALVTHIHSLLPDVLPSSLKWLIAKGAKDTPGVLKSLEDEIRKAVRAGHLAEISALFEGDTYQQLKPYKKVSAVTQTTSVIQASAKIIGLLAKQVFSEAMAKQINYKIDFVSRVSSLSSSTLSTLYNAAKLRQLQTAGTLLQKAGRHAVGISGLVDAGWDMYEFLATPPPENSSGFFESLETKVKEYLPDFSGTLPEDQNVYTARTGLTAAALLCVTSPAAKGLGLLMLAKMAYDYYSGASSHASLRACMNNMTAFAKMKRTKDSQKAIESSLSNLKKLLTSEVVQEEDYPIEKQAKITLFRSLANALFNKKDFENFLVMTQITKNTIEGKEKWKFKSRNILIENCGGILITRFQHLAKQAEINAEVKFGEILALLEDIDSFKTYFKNLEKAGDKYIEIDSLDAIKEAFIHNILRNFIRGQNPLTPLEALQLFDMSPKENRNSFHWFSLGMIAEKLEKDVRCNLRPLKVFAFEMLLKTLKQKVDANIKLDKFEESCIPLAKKAIESLQGQIGENTPFSENLEAFLPVVKRMLNAN